MEIYMTIYIVDLESIPTRYTCEWKIFLSKQIRDVGLDVEVISGPDDLPDNTTPGMFLNFSATNIYKSVQVEKFSRLFSEGRIKNGDYFLFTDAWHPGVINLKYMADLLGIKIKIGGLWHAGSYDPQDGLGRLIGDVPWVRNAEASMFYCYDDNFFATRFHSNMFFKNLFDVRNMFDNDETEAWINGHKPNGPTVHIVGWPMEYLKDTMAPYADIPKKNKIIFPHRIAPEKQIEIFRDLAVAMPEYEWFVAQDQTLTKDEYHTHMAESKLMFSASLQETLGIGAYEAALVGTMPILPNRLSYAEMWNQNVLYPSNWTKNWESYLSNKTQLIEFIKNIMEENNQDTIQTAHILADETGDRFFNGKALYEVIANPKA